MNYSQKSRLPAALLAFLMMAGAGCSDPPPGEEALRLALDESVTALEERDLSTVMGRVHEDFELDRSEGNLGYQATRTLLMHSLRRYQKISITLTNIEVRIDPVKLDEADVTFNALLTAGRGWLPEDGNLYRINSRWIYDDRWRLTQLKSRRALE